VSEIVDDFAEERNEPNDPSPRPEWWRAWCGPLAYSHLGRDELFPANRVLATAHAVAGSGGGEHRQSGGEEREG
jgi:hypothetical protein